MSKAPAAAIAGRAALPGALVGAGAITRSGWPHSIAPSSNCRSSERRCHCSPVIGSPGQHVVPVGDGSAAETCRRPDHLQAHHLGTEQRIGQTIVQRSCASVRKFFGLAAPGQLRVRALHVGKAATAAPRANRRAPARRRTLLHLRALPAVVTGGQQVDPRGYAHLQPCDQRPCTAGVRRRHDATVRRELASIPASSRI